MSNRDASGEEMRQALGSCGPRSAETHRIVPEGFCATAPCLKCHRVRLSASSTSRGEQIQALAPAVSFASNPLLAFHLPIFERASLTSLGGGMKEAETPFGTVL
jgi:hypothetical protein